MPNWVYNDVSIQRDDGPYLESDHADLQQIVDTVRRVATEGKRYVGDQEWVEGEYLIDSTLASQGGLFAQFVPPPTSGLYHADSPVYPEGYDPDTMPLELCDEALQKAVEAAKREFDENNWYGWNCSHWGTKWDVHGFTMNVHRKDGKPVRVELKFQTAWAAPSNFLNSFSELYPNLTVENNWIEEQGFGAIDCYSNGVHWLDGEWDSPESHKDWVEIGREDECKCEWSEWTEVGDWFDDCPGICPTCFYPTAGHWDEEGKELCSTCNQKTREKEEQE